MSRTDVLVTAEWAELNLDNPNAVFVEVDEDTSAYDGGHIEGAVKLDWRIDLQDPVRRDFVDQDQFSELLSDRGVLVLQALRPRERQAARWRAQEVGTRRAPADH